MSDFLRGRLTLTNVPVRRERQAARLEAAVVAVIAAWPQTRRLQADQLTIDLSAGPEAFEVTEALGAASREGRPVAGYLMVDNGGAFAFEGVWTVAAITHVHGDPSPMTATLVPEPGTVVLFTPFFEKPEWMTAETAAPQPAAPVAPPVVEPAPVPAMDEADTE
jgi:hypothetical protein